MFRSIKWKLVTSYVILTLLTVTVLGGITYTLVRQYIDSQEEAFLSTYAEVLAGQAQDYLSPEIEYEQLFDLANTVSLLGNFRVIFHDRNHDVILDTGSPPIVDYFPWIIQAMRFEDVAKRDPFIISIPETFDLSPRRLHEIPSPLIETLLEQIQAQYIHRDESPSGIRVFLREVSNSAIGIPLDRSTRTLSRPIGEPNIPYGYVDVLEGPAFGAETLETTARAFLIAAASAILLAGIIGLFMSKRLTSPLIQLSDIADQMSTGDLSIRSPGFGKDEIGQLAQRFNQMAERLEESFSTLSTERDTLRRFISDASHELRTPITAMKNFIELLQGKAKKDATARDEFLMKSEEQLDRMQWITQNLLDLSRLDAGILTLKQEPKDVKEILRSITKVFSNRAYEKGILFLIDEPDPSFEVIADHSLLEIALSNLLDNALKFTAEGGKVKLSSAVEVDHIRFTVQDTGCGIDSEDLPHIFDRFYRGKSVPGEGSGLGLAMVDGIIKAHGGNVSVESVSGIGSTISIELPISIDEPTKKRSELDQE